jgi:hypothetical protein
MPQVGFEPTISVFERTKTIHVLDRTAGHADRQITEWKTKMNGSSNSPNLICV